MQKCILTVAARSCKRDEEEEKEVEATAAFESASGNRPSQGLLLSGSTLGD